MSSENFKENANYSFKDNNNYNQRIVNNGFYTMNKVFLSGQVEKDPKIIEKGLSGNDNSNSTVTYMTFTLITSYDDEGKRDDVKGKKEEKHSIIFYKNNSNSKQFDFLVNNCKKGAFVFIEGRLQYFSTKEADGTIKVTSNIHGKKISFLGYEKDDGRKIQHFNEITLLGNVACDSPKLVEKDLQNGTDKLIYLSFPVVTYINDEDPNKNGSERHFLIFYKNRYNADVFNEIANLKQNDQVFIKGSIKYFEVNNNLNNQKKTICSVYVRKGVYLSNGDDSSKVSTAISEEEFPF